MKVFVATARTQGSRPGDFCGTVDGELVRLPGITCDCADCGCDRAMAGLSSSRATTTFAVRDRADLTPELYAELMIGALSREGWIRPGVAADETVAADSAREHLELADPFDEDDVLEIHRGRIRRRQDRD